MASLSAQPKCCSGNKMRQQHPSTAPEKLQSSLYITEWGRQVTGGHDARCASRITCLDPDEEEELLQVISSSRMTGRLEESEDSDTDLEDEWIRQGHQKTYRSRTPLEVYKCACLRYQVIGSTHLIQQLQKIDEAPFDTNGKICMSYKSLCTEDLMALLTSIMFVDILEELDLRGNNFDGGGLKALADVLCSGLQVRTLDISENNLGEEGAQEIGRILQHNDTLWRLNAAGNGFKENDVIHIVEALKISYSLTELDLSHNQFREDGGLLLGHVIANNDSITKMNLSWNHLRLKGAIAVAAGLKMNDTLTELDLSWNGFANDGAKAIGDALSENASLVNLDVSSNRINAKGADLISSGLKLNKTLQILKMNLNPVTSVGAMRLAYVIKQNNDSALTDLYIKETPVTYDVEVIVNDIKEKRPFTLHHGKFIKSQSMIGQRLLDIETDQVDPFKLLMVHCKSEGLRLWDMFSQFDKDGSLCISPEEFQAGIKMAKLPITDSQLAAMTKSIDMDRDGQIDFGELLSHHKEFKLKERKLKKKMQEQRTDVFSMALQIARLDLKVTSPSNSRPNSSQRMRKKSAQNRPIPEGNSSATRQYPENSGHKAASKPVPIVKVETLDDNLT